MLQPHDLAACPASSHPNPLAQGLQAWVRALCVLLLPVGPMSASFHGLTLLCCLRAPGKNHSRTWYLSSSGI